MEAFRPLAISRQVHLRRDHPARPLVAAASVPSVERCLENLIANALEALGAHGGEVHLAVHEEPHVLAADVADNGQPLPALRLDPFAGGISTRRGGSGIGLASVRTLAEAQGGKVEYDEREPGWVRFALYLRRWS